MKRSYLVVALLLAPTAVANAQTPPADPPPPPPVPDVPQPPDAPIAPELPDAPEPPDALVQPVPVAKPLAPAEGIQPITPISSVPLQLTPGANIQADGRAFTNNSGSHDMTIRRLRAELTGKAYDYFKFYTLLDFASSKLVVENAYLEVGLPEVSLRFGKDKAQFGIERLQSDTYLTFIERSFATAISPDRDIGIALRGDLYHGVFSYSGAIVDGSPDNSTALEAETDNALEYDLHVLLFPFKAPGLARFGDLAIGAATTFGYTHGTLAAPGLTAIKSDGQETIVTYPTGTTLAATPHVDGYRTRQTIHGYYYGGPVGVLAEYVRDQEPTEVGGSHTGVVDQAWQVAASVAVTPGDHPSYTAIRPVHPFDPKHGHWGAVELAARYGELKIDADAFTSGILSATQSIRIARDFTVGANWYFNRYFKLQINYSETFYKGGGDIGGDRPTEHLIAVRGQAML